jgi:hypothetical protein
MVKDVKPVRHRANHTWSGKPFSATFCADVTVTILQLTGGAPATTTPAANPAVATNSTQYTATASQYGGSGSSYPAVPAVPATAAPTKPQRPGPPPASGYSTYHTSTAMASATASSTIARSHSAYSDSSLNSQSLDSNVYGGGPARSVSYNTLSSVSTDHYGGTASYSQPQTHDHVSETKSTPPASTKSGSNSQSTSSLNTTATSHPRGQPEKCPMPEIPQSFPELRNLSEEQLDNLLTEPKAYKVMIQLLRSPATFV